MIKILIADDHTMMREGLKQILASCSDMQVADEAGDGMEALRKIRSQELDVVLLDMSMPGRSGIELIRQIRDEKPRLPILVLSMHREAQYAGRVLKAGASGYLCKDGAPSQLIHAIRKVASGGVFITQEAAENMAQSLIPNQNVPPHTLLSNREFQIFRLITAGKSITEIADSLNVSVKTVSTHKARIMQKMNLTTTVDLVRYALKHELTEGSDDI
jgi:DNA-binding NarL/FixJ family response regulator